MFARLRPHGLPATRNIYVPPLSGVLPGNLRPDGLHHRPIDIVRNITQNLDGVGGQGFAGVVAASTTAATLAQLAPHGLPAKVRTIEGPTQTDIEVALTGVQGQGQAEPLLGASITQRFDGVGADGSLGIIYSANEDDIASRTIVVAAESSIITAEGESRTIMVSADPDRTITVEADDNTIEVEAEVDTILVLEDDEVNLQ